jgi:YfiH family protein
MWPLPKGICAAITTRLGGVSATPYASLNLGTHVGDDPQRVRQNRMLLTASLPREPIWLNQVHGTDIWTDNSENDSASLNADGAVSIQLHQVLAIMTADCLPVLLCDHTGAVIGAAHAGWRGLCHGVIDHTIEYMFNLVRADDRSKFNASISAYLGPAIGQAHFEVGAEVRDIFLSTYQSRSLVENCFLPSKNENKYMADLHGLARIRLQEIGVEEIHGQSHCCYEDRMHFFSYRRDKVTGRFASLIWKE